MVIILVKLNFMLDKSRISVILELKKDKILFMESDYE